MYYFIFDNPNDKNKMSFLDKEFNLIFPNVKLNSYFQMFKFCKEVYKKTTDNDVVIFWYDFMAVLFHYICKAKHSKIKIIMLNILLKEKKTFKNKLAKLLYKNALKNPNLLGTVTSISYGESISNYLKVQKKICVIHDPYVKTCSLNSFEIKNYIFCGGRNGRDWNFAIQLARKCTNVEFHFVMSQSDYNIYKNNLLSNIKVYANISATDFEKQLAESKIVMLPLNTNAPAGLLVFYQAAMYHKVIITTQTPVTKDYLGDDRGILLEPNIDIWYKSIIKLNCDDSNNNSTLFDEFLIENASCKIYIDKIKKLINNFNI